MIATSLLLRLAGIAALALSLSAVGWYVHHKIDEAAYDRAIRDVAAKNAVATKKLDAELAKPRMCRDRRGRWDQSLGLCHETED